MIAQRLINGQATTFGVSGLLYNTNLIPYDRKSNSNWSQMKLLCVNGTLKGDEPKLIQLIETTWKTWKSIYPQTKVVSTNTGFNRSYGLYPYGDYKTNNNRILFPVEPEDSRLPWKERVLGVRIANASKVYRYTKYADTVEVFNETLNGADYVVAGCGTKNLGVAFFRRLPDGTKLTFSPIQNALPAILIDNEGTTWDIFGSAISGKYYGKRLEPANSMMGFWFSFGVGHFQ